MKKNLMNKTDMKKMTTDILYELAGNALIALGTVNVAMHAEFPLSGFTGVAVLLYRLFHLPVGVMMLALNIIPAVLCGIVIGWGFVLKTLRCMLMSTILLDYIMPLFPSYMGDRLLAAVVTGVLYGLGYAMIYSRGSSTGGSDFILLLMKKKMPYVKTGTITFALDFGVVVGVGLLYQDFEGIIMGIIVNYILSRVVDKVILGMNSGNVAMIVTEHGQEVADMVGEVATRGATIFKAQGGYSKQPKDVVMVAGSTRQIYNVRRAVKELDPKSFTIIMDSNEVSGEGFSMTRMAGED